MGGGSGGCYVRVVWSRRSALGVAGYRRASRASGVCVRVHRGLAQLDLVGLIYMGAFGRVALGLGCTLMGSNSCLASFLAPSARLARCSKQSTAWIHRYAKKWRNILAWLSGALAGSPGHFFLLPSATIEPPRATASALASPWLRRGGSPPPEPTSRAAPG
jgi:hypothetical protein